MKKIFFCISFIVLSTFLVNITVRANSIHYFLKSPKYSIANSLYNELTVIDARGRGDNLGLVKRSNSKQNYNIQTKTTIATQIENMFSKVLELQSAGTGKLVLHLQKFDLAVLSNAFYDRGYFDVKAVLYENKNGFLHQIASIDDKQVVNVGDVLSVLVNQSSATISDFITKSVYKKAQEVPVFAYDHLQNIDVFLKDNLAIYQNKTFKEGIYADWDSFKNQTPTYTLQQQLDKNGNVKASFYIDAKGKKQKVSAKRVYAYVKNNEAFVVTNYGDYPIHRVENDFHFYGKTSGHHTASSIILSEKGADYLLKLNPLDGAFEKVRI